MRLGIVCDSTIDLPPALMAEADIYVVPITILFGKTSYEEGITIDRPTFYRLVDELGIVPTTSQPSPVRFAETYRDLKHKVDVILSMHVTGQLSGTYQSARLASEMVIGEVPVHVFDSMNGSGGLGFMALEARRMAQQGKPLEAILERMDAIRRQINIIFTIDTLRYAVMSGRVGALRSSLASLLQIKPIVVLNEGKLNVGENVRTRRRGLARTLEITAERVGKSPVNLAVIHANAQAEADVLLAQAKEVLSVQESFVTDLAASIAVHLGPGTVGMVSYPV